MEMCCGWERVPFIFLYVFEHCSTLSLFYFREYNRLSGLVRISPWKLVMGGGGSLLLVPIYVFEHSSTFSLLL